MYSILEKLQFLKDMEKVKGKTIEQFVTAMITRDFDEELNKEWIKTLSCDDTLPTSLDLSKFVEPLAHNLGKKKKSSQPTMKQQFKQHHHSQHQLHHTDSSDSKSTESRSCVVCKGGIHPLFKCRTFNTATVQQRWQWIKQHKHCANCLHYSHTAASCTSEHRCKMCKGKHNSMLHKGEDDKKDNKKQVGTALINSASTGEDTLNSGFIYTAILKLQVGNKTLPVRAAFDSGSSHSLITENVASFLQPSRFGVELLMRGSVSQSRVKHAAKIQVSTIVLTEFVEEISVAITSSLPATNQPADKQAIINHPTLQGLKLADADFGGQLDMLIGTYDMLLFLLSEPMKFCTADRLTATSTVFGWVVSGPAQGSTVLKVNLVADELQESLHRMYQLEQVPTATEFTPEEADAVQQFQQNIQQDDEGYYITALPKVESLPPLGKSKQTAVSRAISNERSMKRQGKLEEFKEELQTYMSLDHSEIVPAAEMESQLQYYMPTHGVLKESSTTTAVRPVFDGSARNTSGHSINEWFLPGPNLHPSVTDILLTFRLNTIAMSADISKMYRQIKLQEQDRDLHRYVARNNDGQLVDHRMKRVTFGIRCSPFVATSVLRHHASKNSTTHPQASKCLKNNFYVDDFLYSCNSITDAVNLSKSLCSLLSSANMTLRKWRSNDKALLNTLPPHLIEQHDVANNMSANKALKALGIHWDTVQDNLYITVPEMPDSSSVSSTTITKRHISKIIGMVYDVLGFWAPVTIQAKIILQQAWIIKQSWDSHCNNFGFNGQNN